jgi:hypothetical protein
VTGFEEAFTVTASPTTVEHLRAAEAPSHSA